MDGAENRRPRTTSCVHISQSELHSCEGTMNCSIKHSLLSTSYQIIETMFSNQRSEIRKMCQLSCCAAYSSQFEDEFLAELEFQDTASSKISTGCILKLELNSKLVLELSRTESTSCSAMLRILLHDF